MAEKISGNKTIKRLTTTDFLNLYANSPQAGAVIQTLKQRAVSTLHLQGLTASAPALFFAGIAHNVNRCILFIMEDAEEAGYFFHDLEQMLPEGITYFLPSSYKRSVKYAQKDAANEILRTEVLTRLNAPKQESLPTTYIVTYPEAVAELVVSQKKLTEQHIHLTVGQTIDIPDLIQTVRKLGFQQQDYIYEPGQFAVRGSIVDIFSYSCEYPFRIDFFGSEIDSIRTFEIESQLSQNKRDEADIVPELSQNTAERISFFDFLPTDCVLVTKDYDFIAQTIGKIYQEGYANQALTERLSQATEVERQQILEELQSKNTLLSRTAFESASKSRMRIFLKPQTEPAQATIKFKTSAQPLFHKNFTLLRQSFEQYLLQGYQLFILADSAKQQERLRDILNNSEYPASLHEEEWIQHSIRFESVEKTIHEGFTDDILKLCIFTDHQIFDRFHKYNLKSDKAKGGKLALTLKEIMAMEVGDYIVHVDYGIGKFGGLLQIPTDNGYKEVIRIIYQNNDKIDLSIHSLYKISKYKSSSTEQPPRLSTLGTGAWNRIKEKAKKRIKDIARELIKLYAKRRYEKGFAFSPDSFMQHELEASFFYEDTPDQLKATQEVKADMESIHPMDRLICGDVGFGKTEIAIRAAFKAAADNKQVAVLVPTTVLAFQHFQTFYNRLRQFPVRVDHLSRSRTAKQTKEILSDLEQGKIDILVGTHKLLSKNVRWHDLGLLIIDEEQKFGVSTKEKLRQLKSNVDTLTMSATPIPRTLQFSLMGARDMSIMRTPPPNRHPIYTELTTFGHEIITDAINFEMSRNGQVYFVSSRISHLAEIEMLIKKHIPDCRVAIGHGQMNPEELEKIILGFINHDFDVLLSTTIVENGIDISNANTIIISDAHKFGLSDLHQMRGRVGRSNKKAFCYLLAPPKSVLPSDARRRLEALETFADLGSGFNLAMQDLDIRGAGNLLGAEQSGFMEDLGYETYQKILNQAVVELKNEEFSELFDQDAQHKDADTGQFVEDCAIDSDLSMYFPEQFVPGSSERMLLYRELDNIEDTHTLQAYKKRLEDRFGQIPKEALELMNVVPLRKIGKRLGCEKIGLRHGKMTLQFVSNTQSPFYRSKTFDKLLTYVGSNPKRCYLKENKGRRLLQIDNIPSVEQALEILQQIEDIKISA